jgi:hypothetical protein
MDNGIALATDAEERLVQLLGLVLNVRATAQHPQHLLRDRCLRGASLPRKRAKLPAHVAVTSATMPAAAGCDGDT